MSRPPLSATSETKRLQIVITSVEIEAIDEWRHTNCVPTRSEAIRMLIALGLAAPVETLNIGEG